MTPAILLEELLRYRQTRADKTAELASYTHDDLCRNIQDQIEIMLDAFRKYQHISHMIQGPRDQGVDVVLKSTEQEDAPEKYVGIQVKSHNEIADKKNDLTKQLKAGYFDAKDRYDDRLKRYYLVLAGDAIAHRKRIAAITNEFVKTPCVQVINPRHILTFLKMPPTTIAAAVDRHLSEEDFVRKEARSEAAGYSAAELHLILACVCWALENATDVLPDDFFLKDARMGDLVETYGAETFNECISRLTDSDFEVHAHPATTRIRLEHFAAIRALYFDLQVRYDESSDDLFDHLFEFLNEDIGDEDYDEDEKP